MKTALLLILLVVTVLAGGDSHGGKNNERGTTSTEPGCAVETQDAYFTCEKNSDCVSVNYSCSCECEQLAIGVEYESSYNTAFASICATFETSCFSAEVLCSCDNRLSRYPVCLDGECYLLELSDSDSTDISEGDVCEDKCASTVTAIECPDGETGTTSCEPNMVSGLVYDCKWITSCLVNDTDDTDDECYVVSNNCKKECVEDKKDTDDKMCTLEFNCENHCLSESSCERVDGSCKWVTNDSYYDCLSTFCASSVDSSTGGSNTPGDSHNSGPQTSGSHNSGPQTSGPQNSGPQNSGPQNSGPQTSGAQTSGAQTSGFHNSGSQTSGSQTSGFHNSGSQTSGSHNSGSQTSGSHSSGSQTSGSSSWVYKVENEIDSSSLQGEIDKCKKQYNVNLNITISTILSVVVNGSNGGSLRTVVEVDHHPSDDEKEDICTVCKSAWVNILEFSESDLDDCSLSEVDSVNETKRDIVGFGFRYLVSFTVNKDAESSTTDSSSTTSKLPVWVPVLIAIAVLLTIVIIVVVVVKIRSSRKGGNPENY